MKLFIIFAILFVFETYGSIPIRNIELRIAFEDYKIKNNLTYNSTRDEFKAYMNFRSTFLFVDECNHEYMDGNSTFKCSINKYADKDDEFFADQLNDLLLEDVSMRSDDDYPEVPDCDLEFLNYSSIGYPSIVKNQGRCGACYAFAATSVCESALFRKTKQLWKFSEQQIVDCTQTDEFNNYGCRGGKISSALMFLQKYGPIAESNYTLYNQRDNNTCMHSDDKVITKIQSFSRLIRVNENYLKNLICAIGPVTVAVDASSRGFQFYSSGVFNDPNCRNFINHAMLLVGFGTDPNFGPYWILKNSYGRRWGEWGYMRLARGNGNMCGILEQVFICNV